MRYWFILALLIIGCGSDETTSPTCAIDEKYNPISGECEPARSQNPLPDDGMAADEGQPQPDATGEPDVGVDAESELNESDTTCQTDADQDGAIAMECGGDDCDDDKPNRSPGRIEICDEFDNNCNDIVNDGIVCTFYVHSDTTLYKLDPFKHTLDEIGTLPDLFDIDTAPDGTLYGLSPQYLYRYDAQANSWTQLPQPLDADVGNANGMAIDSEGNVFITSGNKLYGADLTTGEVQLRGNMGGNYTSSGDCVVTKQDVLYMTSSHTDTDSLVKIQGATAQTDNIGITGVDAIWGLTAAWGRLWGTTWDGKLVEIDQHSAETKVVHTFAASFFGAASTPDR